MASYITYHAHKKAVHNELSFYSKIFNSLTAITLIAIQILAITGTISAPLQGALTFSSMLINQGVKYNQGYYEKWGEWKWAYIVENAPAEISTLALSILGIQNLASAYTLGIVTLSILLGHGFINFFVEKGISKYCPGFHRVLSNRAETPPPSSPFRRSPDFQPFDNISNISTLSQESLVQESTTI